MFDLMIWTGAVLTLFGLGLLVFCIVRVSRARRTSTDEEALRGALQSIVPLNLSALFLSAIGLMLVVLGIILS